MPLFVKQKIVEENRDLSEVFPKRKIFKNLNMSLFFSDFLGGYMLFRGNWRLLMVETIKS